MLRDNSGPRSLQLDPPPRGRGINGNGPPPPERFTSTTAAAAGGVKNQQQLRFNQNGVSAAPTIHESGHRSLDPFYDSNAKQRKTEATSGGHGPRVAAAAPDEMGAMKRVPNGNMARDRNSLRAKQKREMENRASMRKQRSGTDRVTHNLPIFYR